jgi:hypothetical protein
MDWQTLRLASCQLALFLWTWLGLFLVTHHSPLPQNIRLKATLLLIFFSGLDILGTLFFPQDYPTITSAHHPSRNLGREFAIFILHHAIVLGLQSSYPCMVVYFHDSHSESSSSEAASRDQAKNRPPRPRFFASLRMTCGGKSSSSGLSASSSPPSPRWDFSPTSFIELIKRTDFKSPFKNLRWEIILSAIIIFLTFLFLLLSNTAAQSRGFQSLPLTGFLAFFLLEGGILWLVLAPSKYRDPRWMVTGVLLIFIPFIQLGSDRDFVMRASIAPLFYLMLMTGETIFNKSSPRLLLVNLLFGTVLGAFTPSYEINRSIYRTYEYYFLLEEPENPNRHRACDPP